MNIYYFNIFVCINYKLKFLINKKERNELILEYVVLFLRCSKMYLELVINLKRRNFINKDLNYIIISFFLFLLDRFFCNGL